MWRAKLIAGVIVATLIVVGLGFLLSAAYLALENVLSASIAALLVGSGLVLAAGLVALIAMLINYKPAPAPSVAAVAASQPALFGDMQSAEVMAQQLGTVLRNLNPMTIALLGAGILVGLLRRR